MTQTQGVALGWVWAAPLVLKLSALPGPSSGLEAHAPEKGQITGACDG